jgi:MFS family permease
MSAGADDPTRAAARVSVVGSIGYCAFLGAPPLIGFLGDRFTVAHGLIVVAILLAIGALVSGAVAPVPPPSSDGSMPTSQDRVAQMPDANT